MASPEGPPTAEPRCEKGVLAASDQRVRAQNRRRGRRRQRRRLREGERRRLRSRLSRLLDEREAGHVHRGAHCGADLVRELRAGERCGHRVGEARGRAPVVGHHLKRGAPRVRRALEMPSKIAPAIEPLIFRSIFTEQPPNVRTGSEGQAKKVRIRNFERVDGEGPECRGARVRSVQGRGLPQSTGNLGGIKRWWSKEM